MTDYESNARLIVRVIRDILHTESFASIADPSRPSSNCALKFPRAGRPYAALTIVASNRPLAED
jgi:hypothetical protein